MPNPASKRSNANRGCLAGIVVGLLLVLAGLAWKPLVPDAWLWSHEQAAEFAAASAELHAAEIQGHDHGDASSHPPDMTRQQARFDRIRTQLEAAQGARSGWGQSLVIAGAVVTALAAMGYAATQGPAER